MMMGVDLESYALALAACLEIDGVPSLNLGIELGEFPAGRSIAHEWHVVR